MYKHQWDVVRAISKLRKREKAVQLTLVGGGAGPAQKRLEDEISRSDPHKSFVVTMPFVPHDALPSLMANADLFIFASSCENLPVTLLEAMATGLPIACSNRGPMPEVLQDGGVYFNPENADSIATAIERLITDEALRISVAQRAKDLSDQYSWARCAAETWTFLRKVAEAQII
jgi:glycosyltransferase involved in cell wall biosynthesis